MSDTLAHRGEYADPTKAVAWQPEQVQSGSDDGQSSAQGLASVLARGLGWFSIGLGVAQLLAPQKVARVVGANPTATAVALTRLMGMREIAQGVGILRSSHPSPWLWSRVLGDAIDMSLLGRAMGMSGSNSSRLVGAMSAVAGTAALDLFDSTTLSGRHAPVASTTPMRVKAAITIDRPATDVYRYWRNFENLPDIMTHLESVQDIGEGLTRWKARTPVGIPSSWTAEIVQEREGEFISWQSLPGSDIDNSGEVQLIDAPGDRGTELHVLIHYEAPAGGFGAAFLKLFGDDPVQQVKDDLRRFKQVMEIGHVVRSDGAPHGVDARMQPKQRAAQPQKP